MDCFGTYFTCPNLCVFLTISDFTGHVIYNNAVLIRVPLEESIEKTDYAGHAGYTEHTEYTEYTGHTGYTGYAGYTGYQRKQH